MHLLQPTILFSLLLTGLRSQVAHAAPTSQVAPPAVIIRSAEVDLEERGANSLQRGLAWAGDYKFVPTDQGKGLMKWYHHWENLAIPSMPASIPYVPMFWGQKKITQWRKVEATFKQNKLPQYILAQNEPDIISQAAEDPYSAAAYWLWYLAPYQSKGVKVSSPAIVFNVGWLETFMKVLKFFGREPDFIQLHYYGGWQTADLFKEFVSGIHKKYGKDIWITEYGVRADSNPTEDQVMAFLTTTTRWLETQPYVKRAAWFGAYSRATPPDQFTSKYDAFYFANEALTRAGNFWINKA